MGVDAIVVFNGLRPASAFRGLVLGLAIRPALAAPPSVATTPSLASVTRLLD